MHTVSGILDALRCAGLSIETFREHPVAAWKQFPFLVEAENGTWRTPEGMPALPLSLTIRAVR